MTSQTIFYKNPAGLSPHSLVKDLPRWAKDDPRFYGLCDDIRDNGIQMPIKITQEGRVLDGETRRLAARALQMDSVPCVIVPDDQAAETVLRGLVRRKHLSKSQMAFLAAPLIPISFMERAKRGSQYLTPHSVGRSIDKRPQTASEYAALMGLGDELLRQANWLYGMFSQYVKPEKWGDATEPATLKDYVTAMIFREDDPASVGEANRAVGYLLECIENPRKKTGGQPKEAEKQMQLFIRLSNDEIARWAYWQKFTPHQQAEVIEKINRKIVTLPVPQCAALADYHKHMARLYEKAAKDTQKTNTAA